MSDVFCSAQNHDVVCSDGNGGFQAEFNTGVAVRIRAGRAGELANRSCEATLSWDKESLEIAANAAQVDVDAFGVDLGFGIAVAALQVKHAANDLMEYQIYSLEKPPRLLRSIKGGDFFSASDSDLDGHPAIWTHDETAVKGFESLTRGELDTPPLVVFRFEHGRLVDASSEFRPAFDRQIASLRKELDSSALRDFKNSDGRLSPNATASVERLHRLRGVKVKVLEIVWAYLYSGRENQAWVELTDMWPTGDSARVRAAILNARAHGITAQIDSVHDNADRRRKRVQIFDAIQQSGSGRLEITPPSPIMLRRPPIVGTSSNEVVQSEVVCELVIDSAGKVRSVEAIGKWQTMDASVLQAAYDWKFIPEFKDGRPVASRIHLAISPRR